MKPGDKVYVTNSKPRFGDLEDGEYTVLKVEGNFVYVREYPNAGWRKNRFS